MDITIENPTRALKSAFLELLRNGCADSAMPAGFTSEAGEMPWQFDDDDEWEKINPPAIIIGSAAEPVPVSDAAPEGWVVPIEISLYAPHSATSDWLRDAAEEMTRFLHGTYHAREVATPIDRTPLAWRLTSAAQALDPAVNLYVAYTTRSVVQRFGYTGGQVQIQHRLDVACGIFE